MRSAAKTLTTFRSMLDVSTYFDVPQPTDHRALAPNDGRSTPTETHNSMLTLNASNPILTQLDAGPAV